MASLNQHLVTGSYPVEWQGHYIGGEWTQGEKKYEEKISLNPSRGTPLLAFTTAKEMMTQAVDAADESFGILQEITFEQRIAIIKRMADEFRSQKDLIAKCLQLEIGKPAWEAHHDVAATCDYLDWCAAHGPKIKENLLAPAMVGNSKPGDYDLHPIGVCTAYLPFSTPTTSFGFFFAGAIIAGCPLVLVSSTQAALCTMLFTEIVSKLDLPKGVFNTVFGGFTEFKSALNDTRVKAVIYTGSKEHCDKLRKDHKGFRNRQLILQSGGKNAALVHSSADLDKAVRNIIYGAFRSAGQLCSSTSRVFVFRSLLPEFIEKISKAVSHMPIGPSDQLEDGPNDGPLMGPLYSKKSVEKFLRFQTMAHRDALENIHWGKEFDDGSGGFFVYPGIHLMKEFDESSAFQSNILFSPDLSIYSYDVLNEAIEKMNATESCLSMAFFGDAHILRDRSHLFHAPNLLVNAPTTELEAHLPLAGRSLSGHHRYHGPGLALYLSYPQAFRDNPEDNELIMTWPWP
ncbi:MAG: aldehyde dehydrogenase family protein [Oligoflexales bacterium]|nr:aldehyde dehydrogenase family protein [Oligoflexales bacterium]